MANPLTANARLHPEESCDFPIWTSQSAPSTPASNPAAAAQKHELTGRQLTKAGQNREAIAEFSETIRLAPSSASAFNARGYAWYLLHNYAAAIEDLTQAIRLKPNYSNAYQIRGWPKKALRDTSSVAARNGETPSTGFGGFHEIGIEHEPSRAYTPHQQELVMKKMAFLICWLALPAMADLLYDNTTLTNTASGIGPIITCVPGLCRQGFAIPLDDVLVPIERDPLGLPLAIKEVTVVISGTPGDFIDFRLWVSRALPDGSPGVPPQEPAAAGITIGQGGPENLTFGNGSSTLFTVQPNFSANPGYGLFYIGLDALSVADWFWANGPDFNLPTAYTYSFNGFSPPELFLNISSPPFPPNVSYAMRVEGTVVPELSSLTLLVTLLPILLVRRKNRAAPMADINR